MRTNHHVATVSVFRVVSLACTLLFFYGFFLAGTQLVIADIAAVYETGLEGMGLLVSAQFAAAVIAPICMGSLADRIGKKPVLISFILVFGIGCAAAGFSRSLPVYLFGACLTGAGYSVCESLSSAVLSDLSEERGMQYINLSQCALSGGAVISPILLSFFMERTRADWRLVFLICASMFFLLTVLFYRTAFPVPMRKNAAKSKSPFTSRTFLCLFAAIVLYVGLENGFGYFLDSLFEFSAIPQSAYAISAYWIGMTLSRLLCGLRSYRPRPVLCFCFLTIAALFVALLLARTTFVAVLLCGLIGAAYGPVWSTLVSAAATEFPENAASAVGIMSSGCGLGGVLYPILMGTISQYFSIQTAFLMLAATAVIGTALCLTISKKHRNP